MPPRVSASGRQVAERSLPSDAPSTAFGKPFLGADGKWDFSQIQWGGVASLEPHEVTNWVKFLSRHERKELRYLLQHVSETFRTPDDGKFPPGWNLLWIAYAQTGLPSVLLDIASDPDMYRQGPGVKSWKARIDFHFAL